MAVQLQEVLQAKALQWNTSFSVGIVHETLGEVRAAAGLNDRVAKSRVTVESRFPAGSVTKPMTAARIFQHYEAGDVDLDAPVRIHKTARTTARTTVPPRERTQTHTRTPATKNTHAHTYARLIQSS